MRSTSIPLVLGVAAAIVLPAVASAASPAPSGAVPRLVDIRPITIEDARLISMSPDGRSIAAVRPAVGYQRGQLCVVDIETLLDRACADLSGLNAGLRLDDVTWSPDSAHLAFSEVTFVTLKDGDLWVMDAATGALTNVDDDGVEGNVPFMAPSAGAPAVSLPVNPAFSPDSTTLAFSRTVFDGDARSNAIATVPVGGGEVTDVRAITDIPGAVYFGMAWAPDAQSIWYSFHSTDRDDLRNGVWTLPTDGSAPRLVVGRYQDSMGPALLDVSPDGSWLLLQDPEVMSAYGGGGLPIYALASADGVAVTPLEAPDDAPLGSFVGWAGFSPDSQWLLVLDRRSTDPQFVVRVASLDGTVDEVLLDEGIEMAGPVDRGLPLTWSANGTAFLTGAGQLDTGYLLTIDGGTAE